MVRLDVQTTEQQMQRSARQRLLAGLPLKERRVDVLGTATSVLEGGRGSPIVLLHGGIQSGGTVWWRVVPRLTERHRVVIPDIPGLGRSEPLTRLDARTFAAWLSGLLRLTCREEPTLVAHSAPGGLAARLAVQGRPSLRGLVLVDAAGLSRFRPSPGFLVALLRANMRPSVSATEKFLRRVVADLDRSREESGEPWEAFVTSVASSSGVPAVKQTMRQLVKAGTKRLSEDELRGLRVPTALLWGRHDPLIPVRVAETASASYGWPLRTVDGAGHLPHLEQPDVFVEALAGLMGGKGLSP